jgi:pimeloyl-ACP methyl ester carboxylesterase
MARQAYDGAVPHVVVEGRKLYYEEHGESDGPPLVLATGSGGACRGWKVLQVPEFSKTRRTVIFDYPGVGDSEPYPGPFSIEALADTTAGLLDALEIEQIDLLGSFMGGMVAQQFALRHAARAHKLVLVGTYARPDAKRRLLVNQWRDIAATDAPADVQIRDRLLWTLSDETLEQTDLIDSMMQSVSRDGPPMSGEIFRQQCDACAAHDVLDQLHQLTQPVLVICGRKDHLTPPHLHRQLADELPNARLVTFQFAAHMVMLEAAERFNETVLDFLAE